LVVAGHAYAAADGRVTIDPAQADHYGRLLREWIVSKRAGQRAIVYLWGLDAAAQGSSQSRAQAALSAAVPLLHLMRALTGRIDGDGPPLWIATRGAQAPDPSESPCLEQAPLWGLGRVLAAEHPDIWGGLVDLDPAAAPPTAARDLLSQITAADKERQVVVRHNRRFVPALVPSGKATARPLSWDPRAAYLIVGGLGGLGLQTAVWMAEQGARRLVLAARTPLPERSAWDRIDAGHAHYGRIAAIRAMQAAGAEVKTVALDTADQAQVRGLLETLRREGWMPIRGVIHAAAVVRDVLLSRISPDQLREVLRPKIEGGWLLHRLLEDQPLDFMVYFSSMGALLGQAGQAGYAAANVFLDALAHYRHAAGLPALSVNWGSWSGAGLANTAGGMGTIRNLAQQGIETMPVREATAALGTLLNSGLIQAVVTGIDPAQLRQGHPAGGALTLSDLARPPVTPASAFMPAEQSGSSGLIQRALGAVEPGPGRRELLEAEVARMLAAVLKMDAAEIDPEKPFGNLGLDSLTAVEFKNHCASRTGLTLSATLAWNHPTVRTLAAHLAEKMGIALDAAKAGAQTTTPDALGSDRPMEKPADAHMLESVGNLSDEEALRQLMGGA